MAEPRFPKSLYLIQPLYSSYGLNPVATNAQASVPIPDGLDLDAWIVPPPPEPVSQLDEERKLKKSKKGKGKEVNGTKSKNGKKKKHRENDDDSENGVVLTPALVEVESAEERAERERVRTLASLDRFA